MLSSFRHARTQVSHCNVVWDTRAGIIECPLGMLSRPLVVFLLGHVIERGIHRMFLVR